MRFLGCNLLAVLGMKTVSIAASVEASFLSLGKMLRKILRSLSPLLACCCAWAMTGTALASPAVALYYGSKPPFNDLRVFDIVVVEPDHDIDPKRDTRPGSELYAYVSVAEVQPSRKYFSAIPAAWKMTRNEDWASVVVDQTPAEWPAFFADKVVGPLWQRGYRGFFLDTLDSYRLAKNFDEAAQQAGLVRVIETLHQRFPGIKLILNRGFEIIPRVKDKVQMVAAESLYRGWHAGLRRYQEVPAADREWLLARLKEVRERWKIPVLAIDYVAPHDRKLARETAEKIRQLDFIPWVTDYRLFTVGVGLVEVVPRRVLMLYDSTESPALNYSNAHRFLQMPLNQMGYIVDYADTRKPLPEEIYGDRYAGIATWFSGYLPDADGKALASWLTARIDEGMRLAVVGNFGFAPDRQFSSRLGLRLEGEAPRGSLKVQHQDAMLGFEIAPNPASQPLMPLRLQDKDAKPLIEVRDAAGRDFVGGAVANWGGFILDPFALVEVPGTEFARWVIDPFAFLKASLDLPPIPVPDITTENGRRLFFSHIDGDGFPSLAELPGSPVSAQVLLTDVLEKYRVPTTMSVIEAETAAHGLFPKLSPQLEDIARKMFRLPHVEIASHSFSHPYLWDQRVRHGKFKVSGEEEYHLPVPGYQFNLEREITGSLNYIRDRLAPPGKPVNIMLWSGDTAPSPETLAYVEAQGYLNMNGGDTSITRTNPSLTAVGAHGIQKNGHLQIYAPITNENIYTNLWRGPFYGFERVIESFEMTELPRRLKPVNIYYHTYSASKKAGLVALDRVFAWASKQPLHPVFGSEYIRKVQDFHRIGMARDGAGWRVRGDGELRTLRLPAELGAPDLTNARQVAGFNPSFEGLYVHLTGGDAWFATGQTAAQQTLPYLHSANARLMKWAVDGKKIEFSLRGHEPLKFVLANALSCRVSVKGKPLTPVKNQAAQQEGLTEYQLPHVSETIQLSCHRG